MESTDLSALELPLKICPVPLLRGGFISQSKAYYLVKSPPGRKGKLEAQSQPGAQKPFWGSVSHGASNPST